MTTVELTWLRNRVQELCRSSEAVQSFSVSRLQEIEHWDDGKFERVIYKVRLFFGGCSVRKIEGTNVKRLAMLVEVILS